MKKIIYFLFILMFSFSFAAAQDHSLLDIDKDSLDSIFDEPAEGALAGTPAGPAETPAETPPAEGTPSQRPGTPTTPTSPVINSLTRRGVDINFGYEFLGAMNPGWDDYPWDFDGDENFSWALGVRLRSTIGINAQISNAFRVRSDIRYEIPATGVSTRTSSASGHTHTITQYPIFTLRDFFFDYNFNDKVFLRAGKFSQTWGVSRNYRFTNLLSRVPHSGIIRDLDLPVLTGPSYLIRFDVPIGVGGLQLLAQTRVNLEEGVTPTRDFIGFGGKYNLAFPWADFNFGIFQQSFMATRGFLSIKTTVKDFELYNEYISVFNNHTDDSFSYAFNFGFIKNFFGNKLEINGEFFYNQEEATEYFNPETGFRRDEISPFLIGHNYAFNLLYRIGGNLNPRVFLRFRYAATNYIRRELVEADSFSLVPGIRITPLPNIEVYLAVPTALGSKEGFYYLDSKNVKDEIRPMSVILNFTFRGNVRIRHNP